MSAEPVDIDFLPPYIRVAVGAVLHGVVPDGHGGGDGLNKDDAMAYAGDLAKWVDTESFDLYSGRLLADRNALYHENHALRAALVDARDLVEEWAGYASDYFQEKWDLAGDLARLDAVIAGEPPSTPPQDQTGGGADGR